MTKKCCKRCNSRKTISTQPNMWQCLECGFSWESMKGRRRSRDEMQSDLNAWLLKGRKGDERAARLTAAKEQP